MQLTHKIAKCFTGEAFHSALRHTRAFIRNRRFPARLEVDTIYRSINAHRFAEIRSKYEDPTAPSDAPPKYLNLKAWLRINLERVRGLELDYSAPLRILDLGCGAGYFLYISRMLGHEVVGLDMDDLPMFRELIELLSIPRVIWQIMPFTELPSFGGQFDLVTAHLICFNGHKSEHLWGPPEWEFFLNDLAGHLLPKGRVCLELNREYDDTYYTPELRNYFLERGAKIDGYRVFFNPGTLAPGAVSLAAR